VTAAGLGLPLASPPGPVQPVLALLRGQQQEAEQAAHLRERHGYQFDRPPFSLVAAARVTARKA
jgi:hypothetical protein